MRFYDTTLFCDGADQEGPKAYFSNLQKGSKTIILKINNSYLEWDHPSITIFVDEQKMINFKNSVIHAVENYMREHYGK